MRQYLLLQLQAALNPDDALIARQFHDAYVTVVGQSKPVKLQPKDSELIKLELGWESLCVTLAECDCPDPHALTVFQLYTWINRLEEKFKPQTPAPNAKRN